MCGDSGAGSLKKEILMQRLSGALQGLHGADLDYIFGNIHFLSRNSSESYTYKPQTDMLTSDQWDEIAVKDEWYRNRIREFFIGCGLGGTTDAVRTIVHAATSVDCDVLETWKFLDNYGLGANLGRTGLSLRSEFTVVPHKDELAPSEARTLRDMLDKVMPQDTVCTISTTGLAVNAPVAIRSVASDSTYYQVEKIVTPTPVIAQIPAPELLAIDLDPTDSWLFSMDPVLAPYAQFNISSECGWYYLVSGGFRSPIDSVDYGIISDGRLRPERPFERFEETGQLGPWMSYELADCPENYPGGKFGLNPQQAPALNSDRSPYHFPWTSQAAYVASKQAEVGDLGGYADEIRYRLPDEKAGVVKRTYTADLAIAYRAPGMDSTITSSWMSRRQSSMTPEVRDPNSFIRS